MKKALVPILFLSLISIFASAKAYQGCAADAISDGASSLLMNEGNGTIKFIKLETPLAMHSQGMEAWLKEMLEANASTGFRLYQTRPDKLGYIHYRFKQTHNGYDVNNGVYYVHTLNGQIISANGEFYPNIELEVNPVITVEGAIAIGKNQMHSHQWAWREKDFPTPRLLIQLGEDGSYYLTYKTDIYSAAPLDRRWFMIDAVTGTVVKDYNRIHENSVPGEAHCKYHGVQTIIVDSVGPNEFRLRDDTRGGGVETYDMNTGTSYYDAVDFTDSDNIWTTTTNDDDAALDAHWSAEEFYDYLLDVHEYESYDGAGAPILSYVHYGTDFYNAFWDGERMTYGDGNGGDAGPLTSTEVVGHEIMHGVTEYTAALIYADESGGLNESYSDIFGVVLDYEINPLTANFLIGDDFSVSGTPFRNMGDPNEYNNPDTYDGLFWDFNEVHNWSGVQNFFFYLLSQGGTGTNDIGDDYDVTAIDMADAADIVWRALTVYMTPGTSYADARFFGIESAGELFGDCTPQQISTAEAWYAVGVGAPFDGAIQANFISDGNYNCQTPATVQFTSTSTNATTYLWDFGNGDTSTEENPSVTYDNVGSYTVTLTVTTPGSGLCAGTDVMTQVDLITVTNTGGPPVPTCSPGPGFPTDFTGVFNFEFSAINNPTGSAQDGYQDYTCTFAAVVTEGLFYPFEITTGDNERVSMWIDLNGDGLFTGTNELLYTSPFPTNIHSGEVLIPSPAQYDTSLRIRLKTAFSDTEVTDPCSSPQNGQVEDYTVSIGQNTSPPATNFVASESVIVLGGTVDFTDLTQNIPTGWTWSFPGGVPATSTEQYPSVDYPTLGVYPVTLTATNAFGTATEMKTDYITVTNIVTLCTNSFADSESGIFLDSGGEGGNYSNGEDCGFLIDPGGCALEVTLDFTLFDLENGFDYLNIYDGEDVSAPLIGSYTGSNSPGTVTASSGKMFIRFTSDGSVVDPGWVANWTSVIATTPPVADFSASASNVPYNVPIDFIDLSTNFPSSWSWDFGDGVGTSTDQNPTYVYPAAGTYTVVLTVENCFSSDVFTSTVTVQSPPSVSVNPTSINLTLECGETSTVDVTLTNGGAGDLVFDFEGESNGGAGLDEVRERLNADFSTLTNLMPGFYEFIDGEVGDNIGDGGGDMYDDGNELSVDGNEPLQYSNDLVIPNANLGTDGQYFTRKYPGLFVFAADVENVNIFSIDGNLGADGQGEVDGAQLTVTHQGSDYKGFVKRVHNSFDPSINHLIIVKDDAGLNQTIPTTTDFDDHDIDGLANTTRIYYLLFAEANSGYYDNGQMEAIMSQFLALAEVNALTTTIPPGPHIVSPGSSQTYPFTFFADGIAAGVYSQNITIVSNDPGLASLNIPVTITVTDMMADFQITGGPNQGNTFNFQPVSATATGWFWEFGDGATSTEENPTHVYQDDVSYTVTLTVTNDAGCTAVVTMNLDEMTGIEEIDGAISLFPNPSDGNVYIKNTGDEVYHEIRVVNAIGQVVKLMDTSAHTGDVYHLQMEGFAPGMYVLELKFDDNQVLQRKFVLQTKE